MFGNSEERTMFPTPNEVRLGGRRPGLTHNTCIT